MGTDSFVLLRDGMTKAKVAAIARTVLFPPHAHSADPTARQGPDRHDPQLRLRGPLFPRRPSRNCRTSRSGAKCWTLPRHHRHQERQLRCQHIRRSPRGGSCRIGECQDRRPLEEGTGRIETKRFASGLRDSAGIGGKAASKPTAANGKCCPAEGPKGRSRKRQTGRSLSAPRQVIGGHYGRSPILERRS
jgi:DNA end-binding protein Ku